MLVTWRAFKRGKVRCEFNVLGVGNGLGLRTATSEDIE